MKLGAPPITRIALYVRDLQKVVAFYERHFGFRSEVAAKDKIVLTPANGGCSLVLLQASRSSHWPVLRQDRVRRAGCQGFRAERLKEGLKFGAVHSGPGYEFSNARDPAKNLIQVSNSHLQAPGKRES